MIEHPWKLLAQYLEENWYTQKSFSEKIKKRVSEINELIKGKRNITISWDVLLSQALWTPEKFWIKKQIDYDYEQYLIKEWIHVSTSFKKENIFHSVEDVNPVKEPEKKLEIMEIDLTQKDENETKRIVWNKEEIQEKKEENIKVEDQKKEQPKDWKSTLWKVFKEF